MRRRSERPLKKASGIKEIKCAKLAQFPTASQRSLRLTRRLDTPSSETKSAIVTIRRKSRFGDVPELAPEEVKSRADAADQMFQD